MKHLLASCFLLLSLSMFSQNISISIDRNTTLKNVFDQIEKQTDLKFAFTNGIDINRKYFKENVTLTNVPVTDVLKMLGEKLPYDLKLIGNNITVKQKAADKKVGMHTLTGTILDDLNQPLIGASVQVKETGASVSTDENGKFSVRLPSGSYSLDIKYLGFKSREERVQLSANKNISFAMEEDAQTLNEVVITKNEKAVDIRKPQMSVNSLSSREIKQIPVALGEADVLKSLMTLPGVTNAGEGSSGFNVRGGAADQNLILLDGAPIYSDSHLLGFFSVFNADAVDNLDLYKGGIPSKFGGRVSSVLDVRQQTGSYDSIRVNGGIGLISSRLMVEGPIKKDTSSFMLAGRTSYAHLFMKLANNKNSAMFYDLNGRVNYKFNENNSLHFSGYFGNDVFDIADIFSSTYGNVMTNLSWKHKYSDNIHANLLGFYSHYRFTFSLDSENFDWVNTIRTYGLKYDWRHNVSQKLDFNYGIEGTYYDFNPGTLKPSGNDSSINFKQLEKKYAIQPSAYLDIEHKITDNLNFRYGFRYSMFYRFGSENINTYANNRPVVYNPLFGIYESADPTGTISYGSGEKIASFGNFEPRAALSYALNEDNSFKASYNRMAQYIHIVSNSQSPTPLDVWTPSGPHVQPQILDQYALGYFRNFSNKKYSLETEVFYKDIKNRIDYIDGADLLANDNIEQVLLNGKARSYGLEVLLRKNTGDLTGWISYTLSRAEQKTVGRSADEPGIAKGDWYLSPYDKLHNLNVIANYQLTPKWSFNANFTLQSGRPVTFPNGYYEIGGIPVPNYTERNGTRLPAYHHLDLAATYTPKPDKKKGWQSYWVFSVYNAYARQNAASIQFTTNDDTGLNEARRLAFFGIIPSVSYNFKF